MAASSLNTAEINALLKRLNTLLTKEGYGQVLLAIGRRIGVQAEQYAKAGYPPSPGGRPLPLFYTLNGKKSKFKSEKQRAYFFMALNKGIIKVPYVRTGFLGASLTSNVVVQQAAVLVTVGTNLNYAQVVIGPPDAQSHYHQQTGWLSLPVTEQQHIPDFRVTTVSMLRFAVTQAVKGE